MARTWTIPSYIQENAIAFVSDDRPGAGRVVVTWMEDGKLTDVQCDGWVDGDILFVPFDGQSALGSNFGENGLPEGSWYEATTGQAAIVGLDGAPLSVLR